MQTERTKELGKGAEVKALVPSVCEYIRVHICAHLKFIGEKLSICDNFTAVRKNGGEIPREPSSTLHCNV